MIILSHQALKGMGVKKTSFKLVDHVTDCRLGPRAVHSDMSESVVCQAFYEDCQ